MTTPTNQARLWNAATRAKCEEGCASFGDPPCWRLGPMIDGVVHSTFSGERIDPCDDCYVEESA